MPAIDPAASSRRAGQPVVFANRDGVRLFGMLHVPEGRTGDLGVLLLSPGIKMRVGPHRLYVKLVELFTRLGLPVFRFDFSGLGDSEGTLSEDRLRDVYSHIEIGRGVGDAIDAMDWMQQQHGTRRFIMAGLCGGAVTGLLTGSRDARVVGLLALGITPVLASRAADPSLYMTVGQLERLQRGYIAKLLSPQAWLRLVLFKSDFRAIWRAITVRFRRRPTPANTEKPDQPDNSSPLFPPAFLNMLETKRPMLLVFGGSDRLIWEFEEKFVTRHRDALARHPGGYDMHVIEHANHVLSFTEWQKETIDVSARWLRQRFSADVAGERAGRDRAGVAGPASGPEISPTTT